MDITTLSARWRRSVTVLYAWPAPTLAVEGFRRFLSSEATYRFKQQRNTARELTCLPTMLASQAEPRHLPGLNQTHPTFNSPQKQRHHHKPTGLLDAISSGLDLLLLLLPGKEALAAAGSNNSNRHSRASTTNAEVTGKEARSFLLENASTARQRWRRGAPALLIRRKHQSRYTGGSNLAVPTQSSLAL